MTATIQLTRSYTLSALHVLGRSDVSVDENLAIFGPCARPHGHDYRVQVTVSGTVDGITGRVVERDQLDAAVERALIGPFDGSHLNDHFANTAGEALVRDFFELLVPELEGVTLVRVTLVETAKNRFVYSG